MVVLLPVVVSATPPPPMLRAQPHSEVCKEHQRRAAISPHSSQQMHRSETETPTPPSLIRRAHNWTFALALLCQSLLLPGLVLDSSACSPSCPSSFRQSHCASHPVHPSLVSRSFDESRASVDATGCHATASNQCGDFSGYGDLGSATAVKGN